jgi:bifunctional DNA-binding transcriptional regulator/antitoxin component of YhaV-PrlF toxin-antitoxin module
MRFDGVATFRLVDGATRYTYNAGVEELMLTSLTVGRGGEIALPESVRERYGLTPDTPVRVIETRPGIPIVPLTNAPMSPEMTQELAEWQSLSAEAWDML